MLLSLILVLQILKDGELIGVNLQYGLSEEECQVAVSAAEAEGNRAWCTEIQPSPKEMFILHQEV